MRLDRIISLREDEEELARMEWAGRLRAVEAARTALDSLRERLLRAAPSLHLAGFFEAGQAAEIRLRAMIQQARLELEKAQQLADAARLHHMEARQRTEVTRRVAASRRELLRTELARAEARGMDDFASMQFVRKAQD
jgi:flagellar export protein FliJ